MAEGHGGTRRGAGRKPGSATRRTRAIADEAIKEGLTPLDYMLSLLRDEAQSQEVRMEMAKSAAPYCHARLQAIDANVTGELTYEDRLRAIAAD